MIGDVIRHARERKEMSQRRLAMKMHLHPSTMNCIEQGKVRVTDEKVVPLCKMLDLTPNELYECKDNYSNKKAKITTVWAIDKGQKYPRLITAYPYRRRKKR